MNRNTIQKTLRRSALKLRRASPAILSGLAVAGLIGTVVTAVRATPKAMQLLATAEKQKGEVLTRTEMVKVTVPAYIPSILLGASTAGCIISAHMLSTKQQAAVASAYTMLGTQYHRYRNKLKELYGDEADRKIQSEMLRVHSNFHPIDCDVPDCKVTFYDEMSDRFFDRYEREVIDAEYHFNRNFVLSGCASLNDFYDMLGLERTDDGDDIGWTMEDGYSWVDFSHQLLNQDDGGDEVYSIVPDFSPHPWYDI